MTLAKAHIKHYRFIKRLCNEHSCKILYIKKKKKEVFPYFKNFKPMDFFPPIYLALFVKYFLVKLYSRYSFTVLLFTGQDITTVFMCI